MKEKLVKLAPESDDWVPNGEYVPKELCVLCFVLPTPV